MGRTAREPIGLELSDHRGEEYGEHVRDQLFSLIDKPLGVVLDIGCARGAGAAAMRTRDAVRLVGLEIDLAYVEAARAQYDEVVAGSVDDPLPWPDESFDTVLCYDVLEHTYDPWSSLRRIRCVLRRGGRLHVSFPNARNIDFWRPLLLKGTFGYESAGLRDVTHIRFSTRRDLVDMIEAAGYKILDVEPTGTADTSRKRRIAIAATRGSAVDFFAYQWVVLAEPCASD
jgi:SAM-dependent methyltransferase